MTREEAIAVARAFVVQKRYAVYFDQVEARLMEASRFNVLFGQPLYPCDFWAVDFPKILPPGIAAESPDSIMIEVIPETGEVREVYVGMWADLMAKKGKGDKH